MYILATFFGAFLGMGLISRLALWLTKRLGKDTPRHLMVAHGIAIAFATVLAGFGQAEDGGPPRFLYAFLLYGGADLLWIVLDVLGAKGRRTRDRSQPLEIKLD
jgi:hypothetical protein